jgi:hypothetical protein
LKKSSGTERLAMLTQVTELRGEIGLESVPGAVSGRSRDYIALWQEYRSQRSIKPDRPAKIVAISAQLRNLG